MNLAEIYQATMDDEAYRLLPGRMAEHVGARSMTMFRAPVGGTEVEDLVWSYFGSEIIEQFATDYWKEHDVWTSAAVLHGRGHRVIACDDFLERQTFEASHIYNDLIRTHGDDTMHCMGTVLNVQGGILGIGLHRGMSGGPFSEDEVSQLQVLIEHLNNMASIRSRLAASGQALRRSEAVINCLAAPIMLLTTQGRVLFANTAADSLLNLRDGISEFGGRLRLLEARADERLMAALTRIAMFKDHGDSFAVNRADGKGVHRLMIAPVFDLSTAAALVVIAPVDSNPNGLKPVLQGAFGLTSAEAELALGLLNGLSPEEVAERRDVRLSTVRTQAKAIREKFECRSLTQALVQIGRLAAFSPIGNEEDSAHPQN